MTISEGRGQRNDEPNATRSDGEATGGQRPAQRTVTVAAGTDRTTTVVPAQRWLARLALVAMAAAFLVLIPAEGPAGIRLVLLGMIGAALFLVGGFWFLAKREVQRWLGLAIAVLAVVLVVTGFFRADAVIWAMLSVALLLTGGAAARHA